LRTAIEDYTSMEQTISEKYHISSKQEKLKLCTTYRGNFPFIKDIADKLLIIELLGQS
jgi:putative ATP-dependent endonuclease of OLD family